MAEASERMTQMERAETIPGGLSGQMDSLLAQRPGAEYLRADLQVHTPIDAAFEPRPEPTESAARRELAIRYLTKAKQRGIELVGITEHNDVSWIEELRDAAGEIGLHLLPGFEVESAEGVHVLCLFDPDTPLSHLEDTLVQLGLTAAKRQANRLELRTKQYFAELLDAVQTECGGICIAAHIETDKGLLAALRGGARVDAWRKPALLAAQISKPPDQITSGNGRIIRGEDPVYDRERLPAYVLTSDCRSLETIGGISTWVKMDRVGVEGLRQAFLDPQSRIAYEDPSELRRGARLLAASWESDFLDGVGFGLNAELNCLIGGKGTGKSTAIETIRYALDVKYRIEDVERAADTLRSHAFRSGSKVSVMVETATPPRRYLIERTSPHAPVVREMDGTARPELDPGQLLNPRIYGQKEIFGIAQNETARLEMIDGFAEVDLRDATSRERQMLARCEENGALISRTLRRLEEAEANLAELPNLEEWRERFRAAGFEDLLAERRQLDAEAATIRSITESLEGLGDEAAGLGDEARALAGNAEADRGRADEDDGSPNTDLINSAQGVLERTAREFAEGAGALLDKLREAQSELDGLRTEWQQRRDGRQADFDAALRELQDKMPDVDPERYLEVERRIERLTPLRGTLDELRARLEEARSERAALLVDLTEVRGEKHRVRRRAADRLNEALEGNVLVEIEHQGIREPLVERLAAYKTKTRLEALRDLVGNKSFSPAAFAAATRERSLADSFGMPAGQAGNLERALDEEALLELELADLPDRVVVSLDIAVGKEGRDYRRLERLSPGQKSTAILLLVMQESEDPLLVDQPEDDLDNRFIYDDVVKRLKAAKRERQFLIATHNANIPVLGDAEQIVALDAEERGGKVTSFVRAHGSIDAEDVRAAAEHILEGGREAFAMRQAKYEA